MGAALAKGMATSNAASAFKVAIYDIHSHRLDVLKKYPGLTLKTELKTADFSCDALVLCIKPQDLNQFHEEHGKNLRKSTLVISILAGTTIEDIADTLKFEGAIVRAMPNLPASFGQAATAMCQNYQCSEQQANLAQVIFDSVGSAWWTRETLLDAVTGLSGSGPAYIFMIIEALSDGGVKMGLPRDLSTALSIQTVLGAAVHVKETGLHPAVLKEKVTTPGGTTINAIHELEKHGLRSMLISAVATATKQASKLRKGKAR
jgi:pyrroline-5-carboxylate reductase